ncbi:MAG: hypothetical protein GXY96_01795 [Tissierellia bacterium]|nr:hypothetical protein [Tissierellia bacterium]
MIIGILTGLVSLRIEGFYLAIATLAISEILRKVFVEFEKVNEKVHTAYLGKEEEDYA